MKAATHHKQCYSAQMGGARKSPSRALASHQPRRAEVTVRAAPRLTAPVLADAPMRAAVHREPTCVPHDGSAVPCVLHIDSDFEAAGKLAALLTPEARVVHVSTLAEARRLLCCELFALVVLDPMLPDGDGRVLLGALERTPLLFHSALAPDLRGHAGVYLSKPWTSQRELWNTISTMLGIASIAAAGD